MVVDSIERAIWREYWRQSLVCLPNYCPFGWWENDLYRVTKAGRWIEYEIKRSRGDFLADRSKSQMRRGVVRNKHELLAQGDPSGPSRFYFVIPAGLAIEPPDWAGLIAVKTYRCGMRPMIVRSAPALHNQVVAETAVPLAMKTAYYRFSERPFASSVGFMDQQDGEGI